MIVVQNKRINDLSCHVSAKVFYNVSSGLTKTCKIEFQTIGSIKVITAYRLLNYECNSFLN